MADFTEEDRVDFPNYMDQKVETYAPGRNQKLPVMDLPNMPMIGFQTREKLEEPTLMRYSDDMSFREQIARHYENAVKKPFTRQPFKATELPAPRMGVQQVEWDEYDYRPAIKALTLSADDLMMFDRP
ncbi:hypothetical protein D3H64_00990 [Atopobacter sp. AH10]|uniref:hypothetical protein n=1 Tax=Atopobacter sp. AH10 TaxID=2315861 RepID=UPI000EF27F52|nr:hypothetical protein [Atopobacter sp. AH10]RLK64133.1 hypothetical protein D3H64_00990 [Atopobacter sp. AH10]